MKHIVSQTHCSTGIGQRPLGTQLAVCARACVYCIRISVMQEEERGISKKLMGFRERNHVLFGG